MPKKFQPAGYQPKGHGPTARKMFPISMRLTEEARDQLVRAAEASGRSLAAETEHRLARSFDADARVQELTERNRALESRIHDLEKMTRDLTNLLVAERFESFGRAQALLGDEDNGRPPDEEWPDAETQRRAFESDHTPKRGKGNK